MDTTDGVLMVKVYRWALVNPLRKIFYNLTTTSLSIAVALVIGSIELLQVFIHLLRLQGGFYGYLGHLDFGALGYVVTGVFLLVWGVSTLFWKVNKAT